MILTSLVVVPLQNHHRKRGIRPDAMNPKRPFVSCQGMDSKELVYELDEHDPKDIWWSSEEIQEIRKACKSVVRQVLDTGRENYELSLEILASSFDPAVDQHKIAFCLQDLKAFSYARALERHIVQKIHLVCQDHEEEVLDVQHEIFQKGYFGSAQGALMLKSAARLSSRKPRQLALMLAEFDAQFEEDCDSSIYKLLDLILTNCKYYWSPMFNLPHLV